MTIQPIEKPIGSLEAQMHYAEVLAESNLLPAQYRKNPANVLLAAQLGDALGIPTIQAINSIHVIEGKPSAGAELMASIVRRAGHRIRVTERAGQDGPIVTAQLIRSDDPDFTFEAVWDMKKARAAKLDKKDNWVKYPGSMMRARAIMEVCRAGASEAMYGVSYTPEELEDVAGAPSMGTATQTRDWWAETDAATSVETLAALWSEAHRAGQLDERLQEHMRGRRTALTQPEAEPESEVVEAELIDTETGEVIEPAAAEPDPEVARRRKMTTALLLGFKRVGIEDRAERLYWTAVVVGRRDGLTSTNDLSLPELRAALSHVERVKDRDALEALGAVLEAEREGQGDA